MTLWVCVNISASRGLLGFKDMSVFVQVKSSKSPMTEVMIHYLYGICRNFDAKYGLLIIWGRITRPAEKEIRHSFHKTQLWDQEEIFVNYNNLDDYVKYELPLKPIMMLVNDDYSMGLPY